MSTAYDIPNTTAKVLLDVPASATETVVLVLPGISGKVFSDRYQPLVDALVGGGIAVARLHSWESEEEVVDMTVEAIQRDIDLAVEFLLGQGYAKIAAVGKSFGGGMMLANTNAKVVAKVLWAPAIGVTEVGGTIAKLRTQKLRELRLSLLDITLDHAHLAAYHGAVCLIHGTADQAIPFSNSEKIQARIPGSVLIPIEGADHSYRDPAHEAQVIAHAVSFIRTSVR